MDSLEDHKHQIAKLEDDANVKTSIIRVSRQALDELATSHDLDDGTVGIIKQSIHDHILKSNKIDYRDLLAIVAQAVSVSLEKSGLERPRLALDLVQLARKKLTVTAPVTDEGWPPNTVG